MLYDYGQDDHGFRLFGFIKQLKTELFKLVNSEDSVRKKVQSFNKFKIQVIKRNYYGYCSFVPEDI